jgi:hypothetical protein
MTCKLIVKSSNQMLTCVHMFELISTNTCYQMLTCVRMFELALSQHVFEFALS